MTKSDLIRRADVVRLLVERYKFTTSEATEILSELPSAERNCFTCGMEDGVMAFNPEKVDDEVLDADTRLVRLSDVCKLIQDNYEVSPYVWGKLRSLPSADAVSRDAIMSAKFHPLPYTHITPTDADAESYKRGWNDALDAVADNAPSAEAEWIPCSERLPDAEDCPMDCIVTRKNEFIGNFVDMAVAESEAPATEPEADKDSRGNMSLKPPWDSISRSDAKDKAKEIMYSILDDTDYNDIESMAHACLMMKIKILKMFDEFPSAEAVQRGW